MKRTRATRRSGPTESLAEPDQAPDLLPELWSEVFRKFKPAEDAHWLLASSLVCRQWRGAVLGWLRVWIGETPLEEWPDALRLKSGVKPCQYNMGTPFYMNRLWEALRILFRPDLNLLPPDESLSLLVLSLLAHGRLVDLASKHDIRRYTPANAHLADFMETDELRWVFYRTAPNARMRPLLEHPGLKIAHGMGTRKEYHKRVLKHLKTLPPTHAAIIRDYLKKRMSSVKLRALCFGLLSDQLALKEAKPRSPLSHAVVDGTHLFDPVAPSPLTLYVRRPDGLIRNRKEPALQGLWVICRWESDYTQSKLVELLRRVLAMANAAVGDDVVNACSRETEEYRSDDQDDDVFAALVPGMKRGSLLL